jgi:hypothetical protein
MNPKLPIPPDQLSPFGLASSRRLVQARGVATRYGIHLGSVSRWIARGVIPPPDLILNDRRYWYLASLESAERRNAVEHAGARKRTGAAAAE